MYLRVKNIPAALKSILFLNAATYIGVKEKGSVKMLFSELKCKDVINVKNCKKLGRVCDLEFDACSGCICKIMVPGCNKVLSFLNCEPNIVIPFKDICQIGPDIILVDIKC